MASHRKPKPARGPLAAPGTRTAIGLSTAALATVTLLSETAAASPSKPEPSITEVKEQVDSLYRQAATATQRYNQAKEKADKQRTRVDTLLDQVARDTDDLNEARAQLGRYAAAQYRYGGASPTATLLLTEDPQQLFEQERMLDRIADDQAEAVDEFRTQRTRTTEKREQASRSLGDLSSSQKELATEKKAVQKKLSEARTLLANLNEKERARLAELERQRREEAQRKADELARQERERDRLAAEERARQEEEQKESETPVTPETPPAGDDGGSDGSGYAAQAAKAIDFARAQIGKPYVWGAVGPNSYDCSGLTQAAWKAAGVDLPRTTWDQVEVGQRVATADLLPGDLVFFYDDISHVGLYIGEGQMIHAPKPGDYVKVAPITEMPIYGSVRPA